MPSLTFFYTRRFFFLFSLVLLWIGYFLFLLIFFDDSLPQASSPFEWKNLVKNGSFEQDALYWEEHVRDASDGVPLTDQYGAIALEGEDVVTFPLDLHYLDSPVAVKYFPEDFSDTLQKSVVYFTFTAGGKPVSRLSYVLNGTYDHGSTANSIVDGLSYITSILNAFPIQQEHELVFDNILRDFQNGARKIGAPVFEKDAIESVEVMLHTWRSPDDPAPIKVQYKGWDAYLPRAHDRIASFSMPDRVKENASAIYRSHYLPSDGEKNLELFLPLHSPVTGMAFEQGVSVQAGRQYLFLFDVQKRVGLDAPSAEVTNKTGEKVLLSLPVHPHLSLAGWTRMGGVFEAEDEEVVLRLPATNRSNDMNSHFSYDNVRLFPLPKLAEDELSSLIASDLLESLKGNVIESRLIDTPDSYPPGFSEEIARDYEALGVPIYDLFFSEGKFYSDPLFPYNAKGVKAVFQVEGTSYDAFVRIRGDNAPHFYSATKSLRVDFASSDGFKEKKALNLLRPSTRDFIQEPYNYSLANKLGLVVPENRFVFLRVNGRPYGIMYDIEHWGNALMERNLKPMGDIYNDETEVLGPYAFDIYKKMSADAWEKYTRDPSRPKEDKTNILLLVSFMNLDFYEAFRSLVNTNQLLRWNAHMILTGSAHQGYQHNNRPYFDPTRGEFEFIPWDTKYSFSFIGDQRVNPFVDYSLKDVSLFDARNMMVWDYLQNGDNLPEDVQYYDSLLRETQNSFRATEHYTSGGGEMVTYTQLEPMLDHTEKIPSHYENVQLLLSRKAPYFLRYRFSDELLASFTLEPSETMFSSGVLRNISVVPSVLQQFGLTVWKDDGNGLFDDDQDTCVQFCDGESLSDMNITLPSKMHYELYLNTRPFVFLKNVFEGFLQSDLLSEAEKEILSRNYEYMVEQDNYVLVATETNENKQELNPLLKKMGIVPEYVPSRFFLKVRSGNIKNLIPFLTFDLLQKTSGEPIGVDTFIDDSDLPVPLNPSFSSGGSGDSQTPHLDDVFDALDERYPENVFLDPYRSLRFLGDSEEEFLLRYPFFVKDPDVPRTYRLPKGKHAISETIIVPKDFSIVLEPGVRMVFSPGVSFIVYGKLKAVGTEADPIVFTSRFLRSWGVVGLVQEESGGEFDHCVFENGTQDSLLGVSFSGMLSVYHADASIKNCEFRSASQGDDAVNLKNGRFIIEDSFFHDNSKDALDIDFAHEGSLVRGSTFEDNGNDGIDISSSVLELYDNTLRGSKDKGISIGERSEVRLYRHSVEYSGFGVAVKDSSVVSIFETEFIGNRVGVAAYRKKSLFEGGRVFVSQSAFSENEQDFGLDEVSEGFVASSTYQLSDTVFQEPIKEPARTTITKKSVFKNYIQGKLEDVGYRFVLLKNNVLEVSSAPEVFSKSRTSE